MRSPAIVATCMLLVATLASPGVAMAKGGNGQHSSATPEASDARRPDAGTKARTSAKPKVASPQAGTKKKVARKPARKAPKIAATKKTGAAQQPQSPTPAQPANAAPSKAIPASQPSDGPASNGVSPDKIEMSDTGTRGVLDTIQTSLNTSLESVRAAFAAVWSTLTA